MFNSHIFTPPVIDNGRIYFALSTDRSSACICCLDAETGEVLWKKEVKKGESGLLPTMGTFLLASKGTLVYKISSTIHCLDGETGVPLWEYSLPRKMTVDTPMAMQDDILIIRGHDTILAIQMKNGHFLWETPVSGLETHVTVADETVFVGSDDGNLYMLNVKTGEVKATHYLGENVYDPIVASQKVFITSRRTLYVY